MAVSDLSSKRHTLGRTILCTSVFVRFLGYVCAHAAAAVSGGNAIERQCHRNSQKGRRDPHSVVVAGSHSGVKDLFMTLQNVFVSVCLGTPFLFLGSCFSTRGKVETIARHSLRFVSSRAW